LHWDPPISHSFLGVEVADAWSWPFTSCLVMRL
jgi:hypothetical protein